MKVASVLLLTLLLAPPPPAAGPPPASPGATSPAIEKKIDALIGQMTLEEKFGQLQQLDGDADGAFRPEHLALARAGRLGSTLNVRGAARVNELQRAALEARLKIPLVFAFDVIHGYRTVFPVPLGEAAAFDPDLAERTAACAAAEAAAAGVKWTFAPMVDIARDARWGRIVEGAGEDPYLGAALARARVRGFQGPDPAAPDRVAACAKHWVGYGAAEAGRDYNTTDLSLHALRNVYLPPFRAAADAGVLTFMCAFNDLNGVPCSANPFTLTRLLRDEWGFSGAVVSDYESVKELVNHGIAADGAEAAARALPAGVDIEMVSRLYAGNGPRLVQEGKLPSAAVDLACRRVLRLKFRLGLFDRPFADESCGRQVPGAPQAPAGAAANASAEVTLPLDPAHLALAREAAVKSCVLLKNDGVLPFAPAPRTIAVLGPLADDAVSQLGSWTGDGRPEDVVTPLAALRARFPGTEIRHIRGCEVEGDRREGFPEALAAARGADAVILFLGETATLSGEAASRASVELPGRQAELAEALRESGATFAVVLMNGRPLALERLDRAAPAILEAWFPGTAGGPALVDLLFGDAAPGGKLPVSFPRVTGQLPLYYNAKRTGRPPDPANKYTSKYLDVPTTPLYPFGHGLSYTTFRLAGLALGPDRIAPDGRTTASVELENTGARAGVEVVQLYLRDLATSVTRPVTELKGIARVSLLPGERRRVEFPLGPDELGFFTDDGARRVEPGLFTVRAATSSVGGPETTLEVTLKP